MNQIMMVDGYETPSFDGVKRKRHSKKRRSRKATKHHGAAWLCAGAKRKGACMRAVKARRSKRK